ncbi:peptide/nickel transport system substrate-binding protein [Leifsonia sp. 98AMF]|uniref:ABC transporter substrate-binding protein n=1 Tax=unclassified Leifsonia TaxID=2663824 RepID=UPI00087C5EFF|nr:MULTISPECIES: ABC transporter substrate-binding protein [unclassified Leifsonia]SDH61430.1 peptide/nickel transport system substrate-binding protein [Leifsonia sp. 197AMF]SDI77699.1 peptide/nickel transport system substrate-binding protein [Leifsonia sp. 466MF]SDK09003.1 peptide/nickel transport system substrate-binding protein [Leifsonia sp. 157MF]SDN81119.1 peptide/nickel transport system substrate-binding protein [Leifsonia sp. 509MF]SEN26265.1 peptide/nickel transport system substrate-b
MDVTRNKRARIAALGIAAALSLAALSGCSPSSSGTSADGGVLTVAASAAVTTWDPVASFSTEALYMGNLYEPLLWKNPEGSAKAFTPAIAEKWETSADGLTWTFHIRKGVTFHDGEKVDADAVVGSIEAARKRAGAAFIWAPLDSVTATDASTVVMKLKYSAPMDLVAASTYGAWIVAPKALKASASNDKYFEKGIEAGTGPFTLKDYEPGKKVVLQAYNKYWNTKNAPHYKIVDISITPDAVTAQQMLTAKEVDFATTIPLENVDSVAKQMGGEVRAANSPFNYLAYFNTLRAPLNDPKVRQALSYAVPYKDLIDVGVQGYGTQSHGPVPKGIFPYSEKVPQYKQDLEKAKSLLAESGHANGLTLNLTYASENPAETRFVPLIKDAFAKIGVTLNVTAELFNQQWEKAKADPANAQDIFVVNYWPTYSDAGSDNLNSLFHSSEKPFFNLSYWKNAEYDALIDKAGTLTGSDRAAAQATYEKAMDLLVEQAPGLFLFDAQSVTIMPKDLKFQKFNENYPFTTFFAPIAPAV